jgi:phosphatidylserine/phosphatidylglycerophosphate/cardiolipin synthase-like enzyme
VTRLAVLLITALCLVTGCATTDIPADKCPPDRQALENCPPPEAIDDPGLNAWYDARTALPARLSHADPISLGIESQIPVQGARAKLLGSSEDEAIRSLTAKIHMIENAGHSVDAVYYIFKDDLVGLAMLGALCDAVQRGVDVRLMVDAIGSISLDKTWLRALHSCQVGADFVRNAAGQVTTRRARVQVFIFNAVSKSPFTVNRRSHDKLMVVDGFVPEKSIVITGGRNISLAYYGILADGSPNPDTYNDAEILLRPGLDRDDEHTVGEVAEIYFTLLSLHDRNKRLSSKQFVAGADLYTGRRQQMAAALAELKGIERLQPHFQAMEEFFAAGWHDADVRLAHEFANLTNKTVVTEAVANLSNNPNSIMYLLEQSRGRDRSHSRVVSPYLFLARYYDNDGNLLLDEAQRILDWLAEDPDHRYEMITNSVLTSDNFPAQSIVDMDMAPRLLLDSEHKTAWQSSLEESEMNPELVDSEAWQKLVNHPQLSIYETGRLDDAYLGGDRHYGKLHSKYLFGDQAGFIGTANFDYRSRLFNNEMGFFFSSLGLRQDLIADFELLKSQSYLWGSPEWLEMRRQLMDTGGAKAKATRNQRRIFRTLRDTGLEYQF